MSDASNPQRSCPTLMPPHPVDPQKVFQSACCLEVVAAHLNYGLRQHDEFLFSLVVNAALAAELYMKSDLVPRQRHGAPNS
jgi:hypothetical protein